MEKPVAAELIHTVRGPLPAQRQLVRCCSSTDGIIKTRPQGSVPDSRSISADPLAVHCQAAV